MGEDGPKGDMGEKVRKIPLSFSYSWISHSRVSPWLENKKEMVNVSQLIGDLRRVGEEVKGHPLQPRLHNSTALSGRHDYAFLTLHFLLLHSFGAICHLDSLLSWDAFQNKGRVHLFWTDWSELV